MTVLTTSVPNVIDAILHKIRGLAVCDPKTGCQVLDGPPPGPETPDLYVTIGGDVDPTIDGQQDWMSLGAVPGTAPALDERYLLNGYIYAYCGGADDGSGLASSDAQKTARDSAYAVFAAIEAALRVDPCLIAETGVFPNGRGLGTGWVGMNQHRLEQTDPEDDRSSYGRYVTIRFSLAVFHRLYSA